MAHDKKERFEMYIDPGIKQQLKDIADIEGVSIAELAREAIREWLDKRQVKDD